MADKLPIKAKWSGGSPDDVIALQEFQPTDTIALDYLSGGTSPSEGHVLTWGGSPLGWITAPPDLGASNLDDLLDVVITPDGSPLSIADNEVLAYNLATSKWINQTPAEAGLAVAGHTHILSDLTDVYTVGSPLPQVGQVLTYGGSPLGWYASTPVEMLDLDGLSDVTIAAVGSGEILVYQGSPAEWQNNTLAEAGISAIGHTHTKSNITDFTESDYVHIAGAETVTGVKSFTASTTKIGGTAAASEVLSVQTTTADTWIEILNSGGAGQGAFFGLTTNDLQMWNYQSGSISFYTDTSVSSGTLRFTITNGGDYIFGSLTGAATGIATLDSSGQLGRNADLGLLSDVTVSSLAAGEILVSSGSPLGWINNTLAEAGIASSSHTHILNDLTDVTITGTGSPEAPADNEVLAYDSGSGDWINQTPKEAGLVAGPVSSTDNAIVRWDGTNGALVQDSGVTVDDSDNVVIPGSVTISSTASPNVTGAMTVESINGQPMLVMEDTTRANKKLSIDTVNMAWGENALTNFDWIQSTGASDADSSYIMPFDGTIIVATAHCENTNGNTKDIRLYINTTLNGTAMGTLTGGANATFNTTLNIDFNAGDRIRLRAWTGGTIQDTLVSLWIKWRA